MHGRGYRVSDWAELHPGGAVLLTESNTLVVADMHLGYEAALEYEGMSIPRVQTRKIERYMDDVLSSVAPSEVVVAGDMKHNFSRNLIQEYRDIEKFVAVLKGRAPLRCIKGNHDNYLASILSNYGLALHRELRIGGVRIVHGHLGQRGKGPTVLGHIHPSIRLKDNIGGTLKDHCFLYNEAAEVLILPALSIVAPGLDVLHPDSDYSSPYLEGLGMKDFVPVIFSEGKPLRFPTVGELRSVQ